MDIDWESLSSAFVGCMIGQVILEWLKSRHVRAEYKAASIAAKEQNKVEFVGGPLGEHFYPVESDFAYLPLQDWPSAIAIDGYLYQRRTIKNKDGTTRDVMVYQPRNGSTREE